MSTSKLPIDGQTINASFSRYLASNLDIEDIQDAGSNVLATLPTKIDQKQKPTIESNFAQFLAGHLNISDLESHLPAMQLQEHQDNHFDRPDPFSPDGHGEAHDEFSPLQP